MLYLLTHTARIASSHFIMVGVSSDLHYKEFSWATSIAKNMLKWSFQWFWCSDCRYVPCRSNATLLVHLANNLTPVSPKYDHLKKHFSPKIYIDCYRRYKCENSSFFLTLYSLQTPAIFYPSGKLQSFSYGVHACHRCHKEIQQKQIQQSYTYSPQTICP